MVRSGNCWVLPSLLSSPEVEDTYKVASIAPKSSGLIPPNNRVSRETSAKDAVASNLISGWDSVSGPSNVNEPVISNEPVIRWIVVGSLPKSKLCETNKEPDIKTELFTEIESLNILISSICFCGINLAIILFLQFFL